MYWAVLRCRCCASKRQGSLYFNSVIPNEKYCINCGSPEYYIEKKYKFELPDIDYAVLVKENVKEELIFSKKTQIWIEGEKTWSDYIQPKLIPYLLNNS